MSIQPVLLPASYNGVPFKMPKHRQEGLGRKTLRHEYPFVDERFIEDLGKSPRVFHITAIIDGNPNVADYFDLRTAFETALSQKIGVLVHPYSGVFFVRLLSIPIVSESDDALNQAIYTLSFGETITDILPFTNPAGGSAINSFLGPIRDAINGAF